MNTHKQSKSSIIFQTCWQSGYHGASLEEISEALWSAGFDMPERRITPMLKTFLRKRHLKLYKGRWLVDTVSTSTVYKAKK